MPVAEDFLPYAENLSGESRNFMIRSEVDLTNDFFSKKVRNAVTKKIPNIWIVGANEVKDQTVTRRRYAVENKFKFLMKKLKLLF